MFDCRELWTFVRDTLRSKVGQEAWERYLADIVPVSLDEASGVLTLGVANDFTSLWLDSNYKDIISEETTVAAGRAVSIRFASGYAPKPAVAVDKDEPPRPAARPVAQAVAIPSADCRTIRLNLRPDFTFDNFVIGGNNKIGVAAAKAVCDHPGISYNPLFLYGGSGLGKTHLLQAIADEIAHRNPTAKIEYLTSEEFVNLYIEALNKNTLPKFRRHYRNVDVLLIDDVQFFRGKVGSTEEFFHTFNSLHNAHKQIILAADRTPHDIGVEDRLVTRFDGGLSAEILPPDLETRVAILKKKQESQSVKLNDDILFLIASRIQSNMRTLESALTILTMNVSALGCEMTVELAEALLKSKFEIEASRMITIDTIQKQVAHQFDVKISDMLGKKRPKNIATARMVAMYLSRQLTDYSYPAIGDAFNRNHATIVHAYEAIKKRMTTDDAFRGTVSSLERQLKN